MQPRRQQPQQLDIGGNMSRDDNLFLFAGAAIVGFSALWFLEQQGIISHHSAGGIGLDVSKASGKQVVKKKAAPTKKAAAKPAAKKPATKTNATKAKPQAPVKISGTAKPAHPPAPKIQPASPKTNKVGRPLGAKEKPLGSITPVKQKTFASFKPVNPNMVPSPTGHANQQLANRNTQLIKAGTLPPGTRAPKAPIPPKTAPADVVGAAKTAANQVSGAEQMKQNIQIKINKGQPLTATEQHLVDQAKTVNALKAGKNKLTAAQQKMVNSINEVQKAPSVIPHSPPGGILRVMPVGNVVVPRENTSSVNASAPAWALTRTGAPPQSNQQTQQQSTGRGTNAVNANKSPLDQLSDWFNNGIKSIGQGLGARPVTEDPLLVP